MSLDDEDSMKFMEHRIERLTEGLRRAIKALNAVPNHPLLHEEPQLNTTYKLLPYLEDKLRDLSF